MFHSEICVVRDVCFSSLWKILVLMNSLKHYEGETLNKSKRIQIQRGIKRWEKKTTSRLLANVMKTNIAIAPSSSSLSSSSTSHHRFLAKGVSGFLNSLLLVFCMLIFSFHHHLLNIPTAACYCWCKCYRFEYSSPVQVMSALLTFVSDLCWQTTIVATTTTTTAITPITPTIKQQELNECWEHNLPTDYDNNHAYVICIQIV